MGGSIHLLLIPGSPRTAQPLQAVSVTSEAGAGVIYLGIVLFVSISPSSGSGWHQGLGC
jgi:hypothetical protein